MNDTMETINVKPWGKDQGDFVVINKADFDPKVHELLDASEENPDAANKPADLTAAQIKEQLTAKGIEFKGNASKADLLALLDAANKPAEQV